MTNLNAKPWQVSKTAAHVTSLRSNVPNHIKLIRLAYSMSRRGIPPNIFPSTSTVANTSSSEA